jgi:gliding-associated putative ABC transporter substrate-binding component GldG
MYSKKLESVLVLAIGLVCIIIANQLSSRYFFRVDLTEENRYTISEATIELLKNLDDVAYVTVYLDGDFPAPFKRLQKSIHETLNEFQVYAGNNLQYAFVNPSTATGQKARQEFYQSLAMKGIQPTNLYDSKDGTQTQNLIFPGAVIAYGAEETGVMLLKGSKSASPVEQLNQSIEGLEFELANAIKKLSQTRKRKIAILQGHGELDTLQLAGLTAELMEQHKVYYVNLNKKNTLTGYDAAIVAKPTEAFSERDKYTMDQYLMRGGRMLFLCDMLQVNMDSAGGEGTIAIPRQLNLDDMFFRYGFRLNKDYVLDMNAGRYPVVVGNMGENPQVMLLTWPFFPVVNQYGDHLIVRNLDAVYCKFAGTVDTVMAPGIKRTPLMFTSNYTRVMQAPVRVSVNELKKEMRPEFFNSGPQTVGWLMEGRFTSVFKNRFLPPVGDKDPFRESGDEAKIIVIADGDVARNDVNPQTGQPVELGFDQFTKTTFANAELLKNSISYLVEENGLINTRGKEIKIRPLDAVKVNNAKLQWQIMNLAIPVLLIVLLGIVKNLARAKKYSKKHDTGR